MAGVRGAARAGVVGVRGVAGGAASLPALDFRDWREGGPAGRARFAGALREACERTGFFYLRGHGLETVLDEGTAALQDFFALPPEAKREVSYMASTVYPPTSRGWQENEWLDPLRRGRGDTKQSFQMGHEDPQAQPPESNPFMGPNLWPDDAVPLLRPRLSTVFSSLHSLALDMCRAFASSVGAKDEEVFARACSGGAMNMARGLYYPKATDDPDEIGCSAHSDYGVLTLLHQTGHGLQVLRADASQWLDVAPAEGHLVCNIADLMERWTNGRYVSSVHRVSVPPGAPARYSYGFFLDAKFDTVVAPLEECCGDRPPRYGPVVAGEHKLSKTRIQYGEDVQDAAHLFTRTLKSATASSPARAAL
uniref:Fe2OG dioxygenase domain-containing protein n=1 Tax=Alexandrium monilatum TaxID=311494 RepID=A0A7S4R0S0_9DINO